MNIHVFCRPIRIVLSWKVGRETAAQLYQVILAMKPGQIAMPFEKAIVVELLAVHLCALLQTI